MIHLHSKNTYLRISILKKRNYYFTLINFELSSSKYNFVYSLLLKIVAGHFSLISLCNVLYTAFALLAEGTMQNRYFAFIKAGIVSVIAL